MNPVKLEEIWLDQDKNSLLRRVQRGFSPLSVTGDGTGAEGYVLESDKGEITFISGDTNNFIVLKVYNGPVDVSDDFTFGATGINVTGHFGIGSERSTYFLDSVISNSQIEFTATKAGLDPLVLLVRVTLITTPHYLGAFEFTAFPSPANVDDTVVVYSATASECGIYKYTGSSWVKQEAPTVEMLSASWPDISRAVTTEAKGGFPGGPYNTVEDYIGTSTNLYETLAVNTAFINKLVAENAFITKLFTQEIEIAAGGKLRYFDDVGVFRRAVEMSRGAISWLNYPEGGSVEEVARIKRLEAGSDTVILDGNFSAPVSKPWSDEATLNAASSFYPCLLQRSNGVKDVFFVQTPNVIHKTNDGSGWVDGSSFSGGATKVDIRESLAGVITAILKHPIAETILLREMIAGVWGSSSPVYSGTDGNNPALCFTVSDKALYFYSRGSGGNYTFAFKVKPNAGSLGVEKIIASNLASISGIRPHTLRNGETRVSYVRGTTLYERKYNDQTEAFGEEIETGVTVASFPDYVEDVDGSVYIFFTRTTDSRLVKIKETAGSWGAIEETHDSVIADSSMLIEADGSYWSVFRRVSDGHLVERTLDRYSPLATEAQIEAIHFHKTFELLTYSPDRVYSSLATLITTLGAGTYTVQSDGYLIVTCIGGGGAGADDATSAGQPGGGGAAIAIGIFPVKAGQAISYYVGSRGLNQPANDGLPGEASWFGSAEELQAGPGGGGKRYGAGYIQGSAGLPSGSRLVRGKKGNTPVTGPTPTTVTWGHASFNGCPSGTVVDATLPLYAQTEPSGASVVADYEKGPWCMRSSGSHTGFGQAGFNYGGGGAGGGNVAGGNGAHGCIVVHEIAKA